MRLSSKRSSTSWETRTMRYYVLHHPHPLALLIAFILEMSRRAAAGSRVCGRSTPLRWSVNDRGLA